MNYILITGADGFIGFNLYKKLIKNKDNFIVLLDVTPQNKLKNLIKLNSRSIYYQLNILEDLSILNKYKFKYIYHLASIVGVKKVNNPFLVSKIIIDGSKNIINLALKNKSKLLLASTSEIYGKNPIVPWFENSDRIYGPTEELRWCYAHSKAIVEQLLLYLSNNKKLNSVIVRYFNIYGPNQSLNFVIPKNIISSLKLKKVIINESGNQTRSFTYIDDAVDGTVKACESKISNGKIFNLSYPKETSIFELMNIIQDISKQKLKIKYKKTNKLNYFYDLIPRRTPDVSNALDILNWKAKTNLKDGIKKTYKWYLKNLKSF